MKNIIIFAIFMTLLTGCATSTYTKPIKQGEISKDVIITAQDGSFTLQGSFDAPFISGVHFHSYNKSGTKLISAHHSALGFGAKKVRVKTPYSDKELYGVLALDSADERGIGAGVKSYKIIIPKAYVEAASEGKISVVYEYYHIEDKESLSDLSAVKKYSWVLWISDEDIF